MIALAALSGSVIGALLGLVGGGGGILAVPALVYGLGLPLSAAVPASLVVVGAASAVAVAPRARREVNWRIAGIVGAAGIPTSLLGGVVNHRLEPDILLLLFAAIMVAAAVRMLRATSETGGVCDLPGGGVAWRRCLPRALAIGLLVGFLAGLLGIGGGFLLVPALIIALGLRTPNAIATSLIIIVINSASGLLPYLLTDHATGEMNWTMITVFAGAAILVSLPAGRLTRHIPGTTLRRGFAVLVLLVAAAVTTQAVTALAA